MEGFEFPRELSYEASQHLWVQRDEANRIVVGIDRLGLESLGELAYVSLLPVGSQIERGAPLGTLEAAKMTTDVASPVSGRIVDRNEAALKDPLLVNRDPYGSGWLVRLSLAQTGRWIDGLGRLGTIADARALADPKTEDIRDLTMETDSPFGSLTHLAPPIGLSETPMAWARPPVPLGTHKPAWPS